MLSFFVFLLSIKKKDDNLHKRKMKRKDKNKNKQAFVLKTDEDTDPIIIKYGIEIDTIEDLVVIKPKAVRL